MRFQILNRSPEHLDSDLVYLEHEYSFDTEDYPEPKYGCASVCINTLQVRIDDEGVLFYVWGYCPLTLFCPTFSYPVNYRVSMLTTCRDGDIIPGVSYGVNWDNEWPVYINKKEGWVCIGDPETEGRELVLFAPSAVASLVDGEMVALWLHPKELPQSVLDQV